MKINCIVVGDLQENCYVLNLNGKSLIIDPGDEPDKIISKISGEVTGILVTHFHFDHIGALDCLKKKYKCDVNDFNNPYFHFQVIKTPGHTSDSLTFYFKESSIMFTGDFIFNSSIGRMDLPTGSYQDMLKSLKMISTYADDIVIYPGHGPITILKNEKKTFKEY